MQLDFLYLNSPNPEVTLTLTQRWALCLWYLLNNNSAHVWGCEVCHTSLRTLRTCCAVAACFSGKQFTTSWDMGVGMAQLSRVQVGCFESWQISVKFIIILSSYWFLIFSPTIWTEHIHLIYQMFSFLLNLMLPGSKQSDLCFWHCDPQRSAQILPADPHRNDLLYRQDGWSMSMFSHF